MKRVAAGKAPLGLRENQIGSWLLLFVFCGVGLLSGCRSAGKTYFFTAGGVNIEAEVEKGGSNSLLRLRVYPKDGAKLAAKPGITLRPTAQSAVKWLTPMPVVRKESYDYFKEPPEFRLSFIPDGESATIGLTVEYAYCPDSSQCFLAAKAIELRSN